MVTLFNSETYLEGEIASLAASDDFYYNHLGKNALSSSILRNVYSDMDQQLQYMKDEQKENYRDSEPLQLGKLAHWCWLNQINFIKSFVDAPRINSPEFVAQ